jgi:DNA-binding MarR family transcriptional regulator
MSSSPEVPPPRTLYLLRRLQVSAYLQMEAALKPFDVTPTQYMVLSSLATRGRSSSAQLSRRFSVRPQSMIKLILGLESVGHVERVAREDDRRVLEISLTRKGRSLLARCDEVVDSLENRMLEAFTEPELNGFRAGMLKLLERVGGETVGGLDKPV